MPSAASRAGRRCGWTCVSSAIASGALLALASGAPSSAGLLVAAQQVPIPSGVVRAARVELVGPLDAARLATSVGELQLERSLAAGETLEAWVPIPADSGAAAREARWRLEGPRDEGGLTLGRARTLLVLDPHPAYGELDPALAARALPPVARAAPLGAAVLAVACFAAALALALAVRVRGVLGAALALVVGLAGAGLAWSLRGAIEPAQVRVLEALDAAPVWLLRRAGAKNLELEEVEGPLRVLAPEARSALRIWSDGERHRVRGEGPLVVETPWVATLERLDPTRNEFEPLTLVQRRQAGVWSVHGNWALGAPLPQQAANGESPTAPPWLMAGLPPGVEVWLARRADGSWLRWVGRGI